jgi:hypothetical protein
VGSSEAGYIACGEGEPMGWARARLSWPSTEELVQTAQYKGGDFTQYHQPMLPWATGTCISERREGCLVGARLSGLGCWLMACKPPHHWLGRVSLRAERPVTGSHFDPPEDPNAQ